LVFRLGMFGLAVEAFSGAKSYLLKKIQSYYLVMGRIIKAISSLAESYFGRVDLDKEISDLRRDAVSYDYVPSDRLADALGLLKKITGRLCPASVYDNFVERINTTGPPDEYRTSLAFALSRAGWKGNTV
jgi:hypothetical protein